MVAGISPRKAFAPGGHPGTHAARGVPFVHSYATTHPRQSRDEMRRLRAMALAAVTNPSRGPKLLQLGQ